MWNFRIKAPAEKIRNPIQGEFFSLGAIDGPAQALVRESVQNSLDAAIDNGPVRVCITLATGEHALRPEAVAPLFEGAWPHYAASGNGLHAAPTPACACPFLVVEDFGTKGLTGDPTQADPDADPDVKNPFFLFFRAEGLSAKSGTELGRWGIGKFVFPRSSRASTHFGLTLRHDDGRRLLLGAVTLKAHRIAGSDNLYTPDGLYGRARRDGLVLPLEDASAIDAFRAVFGLTRTTEPGLSVVVPFIDEDEFTHAALLRACVLDYFLPILTGDLEITLRTGTSTASLTKDTLDTVLGEHEELRTQVLPLIDLAQFGSAVADSERIVLEMPDPSRAARWTDVLIPPASLATLRARLHAREMIAIRVPITVRPKKGSALPSFFDIYLKPDRASDGYPVFLREGIIISDQRGRRAREVRSLVVIEDRPLAGMLGDSENPAHTQWQRDSSNFRGKYTYGKAVIDFVTASVGELLGIVNRSSEEADPSLTVDYFSIEPPESEEEQDTEESTTRRRRREKKGEDAGGETVTVEAKPTRLRIQRSSGGFSVLPGSQPPPAPYLISVRCAYETRAGNALRKWDAADFVLGASGLPVQCEGPVTAITVKNNSALLRVDGPGFRVRIEGFDTNRDVFVRADIPEAANAGTEA